MSVLEVCGLFVAALLGGALNAVAGGGSFLCFPALILGGASSAAANMTSTVALWPASISSVGAYRAEMPGQRWVPLPLLAASFVGGIIGALALVHLPDKLFDKFVPFLILFATLVFTLGRPLTQALRGRASAGSLPPRAAAVGGWLLQLMIAIYGGFFGGGIGMLMLALLTVLGMENINRMNALKNLLIACINGIAVLIFIGVGGILWPQAAVMTLGALVGGYGGASIARRIDQVYIRRVVSMTGFVLTALFFVRAFLTVGV